MNANVLIGAVVILCASLAMAGIRAMRGTQPGSPTNHSAIFAQVIPLLLKHVLSEAIESEDTLQTKWQEHVDRGDFRFVDAEADMLFSLSQYTGDCAIHIVFDPRRSRRRVDFRFVRDGKDVLVVAGHTHSVFRAHNHLLYFADFSPSGAGCALAAYDLTTGRSVWRTELKGIGRPLHSAYRNRVNIGLGDGVVSVAGRESAGEYVEIVESVTGRRLAHRIYRRAGRTRDTEETSEPARGAQPAGAALGPDLER